MLFIVMTREVCHRLRSSVSTFDRPRKVLLKLTTLLTSQLLTFTTNAPENTSRHESRRAIPITDAEAHVTYHLCMRTDAQQHVSDLFALVRSYCAQQ